MGLPSHCSGVADEKDQRRRWAGYVCPDCRMVFRVPRDHDGKGVVCPSCRRMLRLPGETDVPPPLMAESIRRIEVAAAPETAGAPVRKRSGSSGSGLSRSHWTIIGSTVAVSLIGTIGLLVWFRSDSAKVAPIPQVGSQLPVLDLNAPLAEKPAAAREKLVSNNSANIREAAQLAENFIQAQTVEAMLPLIYHPEISESRLRAYYAGGGKFLKRAKLLAPPIAPNLLKPILTCEVQDDHLDTQTLFIHITPAGPRVDWESWVAWSEMSWKDFKSTRPKEPKLFRVKATSVNYYNFDFKNETEWQSYTLRSADENDVVYGYVSKNSPLDVQLKTSLSETESGTQLILSLKYPEEGTSSSQVLIDSVVHEDWTEKN